MSIIASYFPFITKEEANRNLEEIPLYKEIAWDFEKDKMITKNGKLVIVEGNDAIKIWIYKTIKTERYKYLIYTWDYGCEINNLIGKGLPNALIKSEVARYIEEALLINPYITSIDDFELDFSDGILTINCTANTIYGEVEVNNYEV